jgi:acyl transferase domain-containing protein/NADPH:quinone reductase-like Zn-dependent oxidoreductase
MNPVDTGYVEAHGTGTRVGDPIEVTALHNVFGEGRTKRTPLFVGSVKSNIGHLEAAAGLAGIIKTALMLERGFILPNYDFKQPNEKIPFDKWGLKVPVNQRPWPLGKRWASVNGFGFGGTNAHVVMTKGPLERKTMKEEIDTQVQNKLFVLSANDKVGTERLMQNLGVYLEQRPEVFELDLLNNLAYTLGQRKSLLPWRLAITASTSVELVEILSSGKVFPAKQDAEAIRIGFIFTGQGAQWWAMGRELYERYPIYAVALDKADAHLRSLGAPFSLLEELSKDEETTQINAASMSQPSCTAVQLALTDLLRSWGIQPTAVAGHSSGEIGAAYAAGFITFEDAMTVAYHRGRLIPVLKKKFPALDGCMMAVGAGKDEIVPLLERIPTSIGEARIACINSPSSVTVSGDANAILELQRIIEEVYPGMFARKLQVDTAYHSHHMGGISKEYTQALLSLEAPKPSDVRFHSSLLGRLADSSELDATYWVQNLTCAVRFDEAVQSMCQPVDDFRTGVNFLLELGPHAALQGPIKQILKAVGGPAAKIAYSSALARKKNAVQTAFALTGTLFVKGATLEMGAINFPKPLERAPVVLTDMPRYPWNHQTKFHSRSRFTDIHKFQKEKRSDIIGVLAPYSNELEPTWRNIVRLDDLPWLRHHQIQDLTLFPISGFVVMALEAAAQRASWKNAVYDTLQVRDVNVTNPLMIPEDELEMTITLQPSNDSSSVISDGFRIRSWSKSKGWTEHCTGIVSTEQADTNEVDGIRSQQAREQRFKDKISKIIRSATTSMTAGSLYEPLSDVGVSYGECFQGLQNCQASDLAAVAHITVADTATDMPHHEESRYILHPTLLEQLIEMYWPTLSAKTGLNTVYLPSSIGKVTVSTKLWTIINKPGERLEAFCQPRSPLVELKPNTLSMFAVESQDATEALIEVDNLVISPLVEPRVDIETNAPRELCYKEIWEPVLHSSEIENGMPQSQFDVEIVIVHGDTSLQQGLATNVASLLAEMTGSNPSMGLLSSINAKNKICIFLTEIDQPVLANLDSAEFDVLQKLLTSVHSMLWVVQGAYADSKNPDANMIAGLSRTLRSEGTLMDFVTLDLDAEQLSAENTAKTIVDVLRSSLSSSRTSSETEFMERAGLLQTPRIVNDVDMNAYVHEQIEPPATEPTKFTSVERPLRGIIATPGALDTLRFEDDRIFETPLPKDEVEIQVKAIGLSPHDVHVAVGHNAGNDAIGMECSGIITAIGSGVSSVAIGDRVVAITTRGSLSTVTRARDPFLFKLPDHLSFTMAATIPIAFSTAYYGLVELASISEDESVLIQDAATAAGQAAIVVAQMIGAEVFTTVRNAEEKMTLRDQYNVAEEKIYFTGSDSFIDAILEATTNAGVDVIFNAQSSGEILRTSWSCLAKFGRFIDASTNITHTVEYVPIEKNQVAACVDIASMALERPRKMQRILTDVARLLRYGKLRSSHPIKAYGVSESTTALQALQSENVHGKVVIVPREDETILVSTVQTIATGIFG